MQLPQRSKKFEWNFNTIATLGSMAAGLVVTSADNLDLRTQIADMTSPWTRMARIRKPKLPMFSSSLLRSHFNRKSR